MIIATPEESKLIERMIVKSGVPSFTLMERAGTRVAEATRKYLATIKTTNLSLHDCSVLVLCGPGGNGGDGFIAATLINAWGFKVQVALYGDANTLRGNALKAANRWLDTGQPILQLTEESIASTLKDCNIVIDAIFGSGLSRNIDSDLIDIITQVNISGKPIISVDLPTGIDGLTGRVMGAAINAQETIAFFLPQVGHYLLPGRNFVGRLRVFDPGNKGIPDGFVPKTWLNRKDFWFEQYPQYYVNDHKYSRGHCVIVSGREKVGASRLASLAALRIGAGVVTIASPIDALAAHAIHLLAIMVEIVESPTDLPKILADPRRKTILIGPGSGISEATRQMVSYALASHASVVIDADAITSFEKHRSDLISCIKSSPAGAIITPHEGEFARLFPELDHLTYASKLERARTAASILNAPVILKGPDTVIAMPDGRATISDNAPPTLATAGTGDVLAGIVTGLLTRGMPMLEAANAAVWLHGTAAKIAGPGMISDDLLDSLKIVITRLTPLHSH